MHPAAWMILCAAVGASGAFGQSADPATGNATPSVQPMPFETAVAVQTRLARLNLSCGCIDGVVGPKTQAALDRWAGTARLAPGDAAGSAAARQLGGVESTFTNYVVDEPCLAALVVIPRAWSDKAALAELGYETVLESVAERYHAAPSAIRRLNPDAAWPNPPAGACLRVPNPFPAARTRAARVRIVLQKKAVLVLDARDMPVALFPCTIAAQAEHRPVGTLAITTLVEHPNYTFDPARFPDDPDARLMTSKVVLPPGPNNPVGTVWIGLDRPGYGIHGTPHPEAVGQAASHGCFRLTNWDAESLLRMVAVGMPVVIE